MGNIITNLKLPLLIYLFLQKNWRLTRTRRKFCELIRLLKIQRAEEESGVVRRRRSTVSFGKLKNILRLSPVKTWSGKSNDSGTELVQRKISRRTSSSSSGKSSGSSSSGSGKSSGKSSSKRSLKKREEGAEYLGRKFFTKWKWRGGASSVHPSSREQWEQRGAAVRKTFDVSALGSGSKSREGIVLQAETRLITNASDNCEGLAECPKTPTAPMVETLPDTSASARSSASASPGGAAEAVPFDETTKISVDSADERGCKEAKEAKETHARTEAWTKTGTTACDVQEEEEEEEEEDDVLDSESKLSISQNQKK
jgi:hypothetical protein